METLPISVAVAGLFIGAADQAIDALLVLARRRLIAVASFCVLAGGLAGFAAGRLI